MIILGVDPSLETGLALVEFIQDEPRLLASTCIKPGKHVNMTDRVRWITKTATKWADGKWGRGWEWNIMAIEYPAVGRLHASPLQWVLIGRLEEAFDAPGVRTVSIKPGQAKQAVGVPYHSKRKPVDEVRQILGIAGQVAEHKYAIEAVSDAIAVAIAAHQRIKAEAA